MEEEELGFEIMVIRNFSLFQILLIVSKNSVVTYPVVLCIFKVWICKIKPETNMSTQANLGLQKYE